MRALVLGGNGMLGHMAWELLKNDLDVYVTVRGVFSEIERFKIFDKKRTFCGVQVENFLSFEDIVKKSKPDIILNCIGIVKQSNDSVNPLKSIEVNSLFPHKLARLCGKRGCRLIHLSSDCVFSGSRGNYTEYDNPDPLDLYGRTKLLGEVTEGDILTIRTSMIGRELGTSHGLLEWFLNQRGGEVKGFKNAIFSGFTTRVLSKILRDVIVTYRNLKGIYHVSSEPISKLDLLLLIKQKTGVDIEIVPDTMVKCNRSLNSSKFRQETGFKSPSWEDMIEGVAQDIKKGAR